MQNDLKTKSQYFDFNSFLKSENGIDIYSYTGWNGLNVTKFAIPKDKILSSSFIDTCYPKLAEKEKIFVVNKGHVKFESSNQKVSLQDYDAFDLASNEKNYKLNSIDSATIFMISAIGLSNFNEKTIFFNFKKDIEAKNLWGGQIISRPYEGKGLTLVLFDLKPGFKFEDKGHANEQITWLISGKMDFYANGKNKTLTSEIGVDIGPNHIHGGVSGGALGYDAFYPKREEIKYKKEEI
jgi:quercetin dioxygenase-like cupin family protein